jgi:aminopeptidase-like protein
MGRRDLAEVGEEMHAFAAELYPICRSITDGGIRQTHDWARIPLETFDVPTGTPVFDWTVP